MVKTFVFKLVKYNFRVGMLVFLGSFTLTIMDYSLGLGLGLYPH